MRFEITKPAKATAKAPELCAGQSNSTKVQELCIVGQSNSTKVQELSVVGQSNSTKAQELCVVGQSNSTKTPNLCTDVQQKHAENRRNGYFLDKNSHRRCKNYIFFNLVSQLGPVISNLFVELRAVAGTHKDGVCV